MAGKRASHMLGWVGIVENRPFVDVVSDSYCDAFEPSVRQIVIFRSLAAARKRFEEVQKVWAWIGPRARKPPSGGKSEKRKKK